MCIGAKSARYDCLILHLSVFDVAAGEWTEVPSRKKVKVKREGSDVMQEHTAINDQPDPQQQQQVVIVSRVLAWLSV